MHPKASINDSVYKVFRIGISDVGKDWFGNGFLGILDALFCILRNFHFLASEHFPGFALILEGGLFEGG